MLRWRMNTLRLAAFICRKTGAAQSCIQARKVRYGEHDTCCSRYNARIHAKYYRQRAVSASATARAIRCMKTQNSQRSTRPTATSAPTTGIQNKRYVTIPPLKIDKYCASDAAYGLRYGYHVTALFIYVTPHMQLHMHMHTLPFSATPSLLSL